MIYTTNFTAITSFVLCFCVWLPSVHLCIKKCWHVEICADLLQILIWEKYNLVSLFRSCKTALREAVTSTL